MSRTKEISMKEMPSYVFSRRIDPVLPMAKKAKGMWIEDAEGHRYLDASGGPLVVNVGHGREEIARAIHDQIVQCDYLHGTMFTTHVVEELAQALAKHAQPGIERFYLLSTGSEAVEAGIKLARQIHVESGRPQRIQLISRWKSYHGCLKKFLANIFLYDSTLVQNRFFFGQHLRPIITRVLFCNNRRTL